MDFCTSMLEDELAAAVSPFLFPFCFCSRLLPSLWAFLLVTCCGVGMVDEFHSAFL
jgi:hypothetical protein